MTLTHAQELRALSEIRDAYIRQSQMTVFGKVPPLSAISRVVRNPVEGGAVSSYEPDHVDPAYFTGHSYAELSRGF